MKFFNYSGTKIKYVNDINSYINNSKSTTYIEPFVGSGAVFFNLTKNFDEYILNDKDRNIIRIYNSFRDSNYKLYIELYNFVEHTYCTKGMNKDKEGYYLFRSYFNENYWNTNTLEEGIFLYILASSCINSMLRFGKNGMNQGYGWRTNKLTEDEFNQLNKKLNLSNVTIYNEDYKEVLKKHDGLLFLDPPYIKQESSYSNNFSISDLEEFYKIISNKDEFIYTDILSEYNNHLKYNFLRTMTNSSPNRKREHEKNHKEVIFYKGLDNSGLF